MRLLCLDPQEPSWTGLAMSLESQFGRPLRLRWCGSPTEALALLRSEQFDCILVACLRQGREFWTRNRPSQFVRAVRSMGCSDAILVLYDDCWNDELTHLAELDCEVMCSAGGWQATSLASWMHRSIQRHDTLREYQRLSVRDSRRTTWEREESLQQLQQQRETAARFFDRASADGATTRMHGLQASIPDRVRDYYVELLRTYVIMGSGNLSEDLAHLAHGLATAGVSMSEAFVLHLDCLTRLIEGLGSQSLRHILTRANLLAIEVLLNMGRERREPTDDAALGSYGIDLHIG